MYWVVVDKSRTTSLLLLLLFSVVAALTDSETLRLMVGAVASSGRGRCLDNKPRRGRFVMAAVLPGQLHDSIAQCRFQFTPTSVRCNKTTASLSIITLRYVNVLL